MGIPAMGAAALVALYAGAVSAGEIVVCVYDGVPGPSDAIECEDAGGEKAKQTLAGLYKDGWRIGELEVTSKFGGATTVMFMERL